MSLSDMELERLEKEYFDQIFYYLSYNKERMLRALESKEQIKKRLVGSVCTVIR